MLHAEVDLSADIRSLMDSLTEYKVYIIHLGRILSNDEIAKEVIGLGLRNLTAGTNSPLSDFNANGEKLQKRRGMKPVTISSNQGSEGQLPTIPSPSVTTSQSQSSRSAIYSEQDITAVPDAAEVVEIDEGGVDLDQTELEGILEDLDQGDEPTLLRLTEEDVAYNMDEVEIEVSEDESEGSSDSGEESGREWE